MFGYARRRLTSRPGLWAAGAACALFAAVPGALFATVLVRPVALLVLTADPLLALGVTPDVARRPWFVTLLVVGGLALAVLYHRLYAVVLWESDEAKGGGWASSWAATRGRWRRYLILNGGLATGLIVVGSIIAVIVRLMLGSPGAATTVLLGGLSLLVILRTIGRIYVTLAARAAVLDDVHVVEAARRARAVVKERRREVVALWATLVAAGAAVWLGGRVVTPILQDTALDYPALSTYTYAREAAQLAFAVPLEAFLLVLAAALWTALYREVDQERPEPAGQPLLPRALAALVVLTVIGNGIPAVLDVSWQNSQERDRASLTSRTITPEEQLIASSPPRELPNRYVVRARLDGESLEWDTEVTYRNETGRTLTSLPVEVYAAAFARNIDDVPFADDVLSGSAPPSVRSQVEAGTFRVVSVSRNGRRLGWSRHDTVLEIELGEPLPPGATSNVEIRLSAELPRWPLRFGLWDEVVQLGNWIPVVPPERDGGFVLHHYGSIGDPFVSEPADYDVTIETEEPIEVVGSGSLVSHGSTDDNMTSWRFVVPAARDAAFAAAGGFRAYERTAQGAAVRAWYLGDEVEVAARVADEARSAFESYARAFGPIPATEVDVILTESPIGGMEYPGLVFVSSGFAELEGLPIVPELVDHAGFDDDLRRYVTGHEVAHQWWFAHVGNDQVEEPWLDEALAEASTRLWLLDREGSEETWRVAHLERNAKPEEGAIDAGTSDFDSNSEYTDTVYNGGGAILIELRDAVGEEKYESLLRAWNDRYGGRIATVDDFVDLTEEVLGREARNLLGRYRVSER